MMVDITVMESILTRLLQPDNEIIEQATDELTKALKNPQTFITLCTVIGTSRNDELKEYAALVLRKKLCKRNAWMNVSQEIRQQIKQFLLQAIIKEPSLSVKKHILQLIAVLAKHELMRGTWNELFTFIDAFVKSNDANERKFGMFMIRNLSDYYPQMFEPHVATFASYFTTTLGNVAEDCTSSIMYDAISSMNNILELTAQDPQIMHVYSQSVPRVLEIILALSTNDPDHACDCYQLLETLCEFSIQALIPHLKTIVQVSAQLAGNKNIDETLRCNGISLISTIIRSKKKILVKLNLLQPIIELMFSILSEETDDATWFLEDYSLNPMSAAGDCMSAIAEEISASTFMPVMIKLIDSAYTSQEPNALKASFTTMAFVSDGCSEYLKKSYLKQFVTAIKMGLNSSNEGVKSAALYALGEVSQYAQPQVSLYASEILPDLMKTLKEKLVVEYTKPECSSEVRMMFYAFDKFIDSMEGGIEEYLPELTTIVIDIIRNEQCSVELKDKAITIMCSIVRSGGDAVAPYFIPVMENLNAYLTPGIDEKLESLQIMVIQLLSEFVDALDPKVFEPYLEVSLKCGLALLNEASDDQPEVRAVCYGLFSTVAKASISHLSPFMDVVMQHILKSLDNSLIVNNSFTAGQKTKFNAYSSDEEDNKDESLETDDSDGNDGDSDNFVYMDAHVMEEKENACRAIVQIAQITGENFSPYLSKSIEVISKLLYEDDEDTIDSVLEAYGQLCINLSKISDSTGQEALEQALEVFLSYGEKKVKEDGLENLDTTFLDVLAEMLKEINTKMMKFTQPIMVLAKNILAFKVGDGNNPGELDELDSENNELPIECAGNVVSNLSYVVPPQVFTEYFISMVPLLKKLLSKHSSDILRATGLAIIGESAKGLGNNSSELSELMVTLVIPLLDDEDDSVRNNSVFAIGEIVFYGKEAMYKFYPTILSTFSQVVAKEQRSKVLDNVYGALARMIITNIEGVPLDHVVPVMINYLPLHEDFVENLTIFRCLVYLFEIGNPYMVSLSESVIKASLVTLSSKKKSYDNEVKGEIVKLLQMYKRNFPEKCLSLTLPDDLSKLLSEV